MMRDHKCLLVDTSNKEALVAKTHIDLFNTKRHKIINKQTNKKKPL
jgi:hypothetical protein